MEGLLSLQEDDLDMTHEKRNIDVVRIEELYQFHSDEILRLCYLYLKDYQLAEDALQETFFRVTKSIHQFEGNSSAKTWLIRIAINVCKTVILSQKNKPVEFAAEASFLMVKTADEIEQLIDKSIVSQAIMRLDTPYREVILLHFYQELKLREIAKITGESITTVAYRLRQGKKRLKEYLSSKK